ncbi:hypothetical protein AK830_g11611 [Neonectria ditissima]|uniref:Uncharacterized protein n=1 Tax=Neonectria ditissima TaxID=78410 RepID=A0A0P7ALX2_9HYPO|nr:hypothetical protein AK830_g11611 [Neonectria ditissima]
MMGPGPGLKPGSVTFSLGELGEHPARVKFPYPDFGLSTQTSKCVQEKILRVIIGRFGLWGFGFDFGLDGGSGGCRHNIDVNAAAAGEGMEIEPISYKKQIHRAKAWACAGCLPRQPARMMWMFDVWRLITEALFRSFLGDEAQVIDVSGFVTEEVRFALKLLSWLRLKARTYTFGEPKPPKELIINQQGHLTNGYAPNIRIMTRHLPVEGIQHKPKPGKAHPAKSRSPNLERSSINKASSHTAISQLSTPTNGVRESKSTRSKLSKRECIANAQLIREMAFVAQSYDQQALPSCLADSPYYLTHRLRERVASAELIQEAFQLSALRYSEIRLRSAALLSSVVMYSLRGLSMGKCRREGKFRNGPGDVTPRSPGEEAKVTKKKKGKKERRAIEHFGTGTSHYAVERRSEKAEKATAAAANANSNINTNTTAAASSDSPPPSRRPRHRRHCRRRSQRRFRG